MGRDHSFGLKEFLNELNLLYIYNRSRVTSMQANETHYELRLLSGSERYT
jgi:hypothetical protein